MLLICYIQIANPAVWRLKIPGSSCLRVCLLECHSSELALAHSSLCGIVSRRLCPSRRVTEWCWMELCASLRFKEEPVSRLKIAVLRMGTRGFPKSTCTARCFSFSLFASFILNLA